MASFRLFAAGLFSADPRDAVACGRAGARGASRTTDSRRRCRSPPRNPLPGIRGRAALLRASGPARCAGARSVRQATSRARATCSTLSASARRRRRRRRRPTSCTADPDGPRRRSGRTAHARRRQPGRRLAPSGGRRQRSRRRDSCRSTSSRSGSTYSLIEPLAGAGLAGHRPRRARPGSPSTGTAACSWTRACSCPGTRRCRATCIDPATRSWWSGARSPSPCSIGSLRWCAQRLGTDAGRDCRSGTFSRAAPGPPAGRLADERRGGAPRSPSTATAP